MAVALETRGERWSSTLDDLWIIGRHVWLPAAFTKDLPPIDRSWSDFGAQRVQEQEQEYDISDRFHAELDKDRRQEQVDVFLDHLGPAGERPSLDFAHFLLPHAPWKYLPDGRRHGARGSPGTIGNGWGGDEWLVDQAYQKHLLQIQYADQVVGRVIDRLTTLGVYEKSLIVVVADHGIAFGTEIERRRRMDAGVVGDVAAVPLFIKLPDGEGGLIDDYRAELIDVLPTIAAVLEVTVPWSVEGTSLIGTDRPVRETSLIDASLEIGTGGGEKLKVAQRKDRQLRRRRRIRGLRPPALVIFSEFPSRTSPFDRPANSLDEYRTQNSMRASTPRPKRSRQPSAEASNSWPRTTLRHWSRYPSTASSPQ